MRTGPYWTRSAVLNTLHNTIEMLQISAGVKVNFVLYHFGPKRGKLQGQYINTSYPFTEFGYKEQFGPILQDEFSFD